MMPQHDAQTWLRNPADIDWVEEEAWRIIAVNKWYASPELLFALIAKIRAETKE